MFLHTRWLRETQRGQLKNWRSPEKKKA